MRFAEKERHQIFLEPEGVDVDEIYVNGLSMSLPRDVQDAIVHMLPGLEDARILRHAYAVEYDSIQPTELDRSLETKRVPGPVSRRANQRHVGLRRSGRAGADGGPQRRAIRARRAARRARARPGVHRHPHRRSRDARHASSRIACSRRAPSIGCCCASTTRISASRRSAARPGLVDDERWDRFESAAVAARAASRARGDDARADRRRVDHRGAGAGAARSRSRRRWRARASHSMRRPARPRTRWTRRRSRRSFKYRGLPEARRRDAREDGVARIARDSARVRVSRDSGPVARSRRAADAGASRHRRPGGARPRRHSGRRRHRRGSRVALVLLRQGYGGQASAGAGRTAIAG